METEKANYPETQLNSGKKETFKGTIFSVGVVGAVILITYVVIYGLYMARV